MVLGSGLLSAKNGEVKLNDKKFDKKLQYGYLYQSTCGWTFNMTSNVAIQNMTDAQYRDYMADVIDTNDHVCKLHGDKPVEGYVFNQKKQVEGKNEKI